MERPEGRALTRGLTLGKTNQCHCPERGFIGVLLQRLLLTWMSRGGKGAMQSSFIVVPTDQHLFPLSPADPGANQQF